MLDSIKKSLVIFIYFALTLSTLLVFWQVCSFNFINYDDNTYVYENPHVLNGLTPDGIIWAFTTGYQANWHPLIWLSLMLDCQLFGPDAGWIHLVNVLFHLANALLLFVVLKKMTASLWPSAFVAAVFALHPMHVESVAWIAERKDVLSGFFWILTLLAYFGYVKRPSLFRYMIALVLFAFGLMAKPMLVMLPLVLLLLDYWPFDCFASPQAGAASDCKTRRAAPLLNRRAVLRRIIIEKMPFIALSVVSSVITFFVQRGGGAVADFSELPLKSRVANVFLSYARYIGKMFWPQNLAVYYPFDAGSFTFWQIALCALLMLVISVFVICIGRRHKYLPVGWFWFVATLVPVIGFVQVGDRALADRYTYIPYIGLFVMIAWGLPEIFSKWRYQKLTIGISMVIVLTALGICAYRQVSYWKNSFTLFTHAVEVTENNYLAHNNLGEALYKQGKNALALAHYKKSLEILPNYENATVAIGCILADQNDFNRAIEYFQKAVQLEPDSAKTHNYLGVALQKLGKLDEAAAQFSQAMELKPDWVEPMNNLAGLIVTHPEIKSHDINEAIRLARRACELTNYKYPGLLGNLAMVYVSAGKFPEAADAAKAALKLDPNSASLHRNLGAALLGQQEFKEAVGHIKRSLEIEPNNLRAKDDLAWILATSPDPNMRNPSEAIRLAQEACTATNYNAPRALDTLGAAYASAGRFADAVETAQKALNLIDRSNKKLLQMVQSRLDLYKVSEPYIEAQQNEEDEIMK